MEGQSTGLSLEESWCLTRVSYRIFLLVGGYFSEAHLFEKMEVAIGSGSYLIHHGLGTKLAATKHLCSKPPQSCPLILCVCVCVGGGGGGGGGGGRGSQHVPRKPW